MLFTNQCSCAYNNWSSSSRRSNASNLSVGDDCNANASSHSCTGHVQRPQTEAVRKQRALFSISLHQYPSSVRTAFLIPSTITPCTLEYIMYPSTILKLSLPNPEHGHASYVRLLSVCTRVDFHLVSLFIQSSGC